MNNISEEGDPVFSCHFKTELATTLLQLTSASINFVVTPMCVVLISLRVPLVILRSVDYAKKKEKRAQIKFVKDETVQKDDQYKSHSVHVPSGEPSNSRSRPLPRRKAGVVRPITQGKRLKKGGPSKVCCIVVDQYILLTWDHSSLREPGQNLQRSHYQVVLLLLW